MMRCTVGAAKACSGCAQAIGQANKPAHNTISSGWFMVIPRKNGQQNRNPRKNIAQKSVQGFLIEVPKI
jgi:hypothetical protein